MEYETIDADILIMSNADLFDQTGLVAEITERGHKPAVSVSALAYIISRGTVDVKLRAVEYVYDPFDRFWGEGRLWWLLIFDVPERFQTIPSAEFEIKFEVEMRVSVLLVDPPTFLHNLVDLCLAESGSLFV